MNQLINDEAVYRTAPATPGLLNIPSEAVSTIKLCELVLAILQLPVKPQTFKPP